jgi:aspartate carbamoyltransferase catalytic subunit
LKHGRTVHSLAKLISHYEAKNAKICLVSPDILRMPAAIIEQLLNQNVEVYETEDLFEVLHSSDVIYWTRVQEERFADPTDYAKIKDNFIMTPNVLGQSKIDAILMHPLPRKHEMGTPGDHDILDEDPRSIYFEQMENGMFVRMALLVKVLRGVYV